MGRKHEGRPHRDLVDRHLCTRSIAPPDTASPTVQNQILRGHPGPLHLGRHRAIPLGDRHKLPVGRADQWQGMLHMPAVPEIPTTGLRCRSAGTPATDRVGGPAGRRRQAAVFPTECLLGKKGQRRQRLADQPDLNARVHPRPKQGCVLLELPPVQQGDVFPGDFTPKLPVPAFEGGAAGEHPGPRGAA